MVQARHSYRKALDVLRTYRANDWGRHSEGRAGGQQRPDADSNGVQTLAQAIQAGLRNRAGGGEQQVGELVQARWSLTAN
jgi:hypothetical protein